MKIYYFLFVALVFYSKTTNAFIIVNGYTDKSSYFVDEMINFYTAGNGFDNSVEDIVVYDIDNNPIATIPNFSMRQQDVNTNFPERNGYGYGITKSWRVPNLKSGLYHINSNEGEIPFIIKGNSNADIVVVYPTNSDFAYLHHGDSLGTGMYGYPHKVLNPSDPTNSLTYINYNPIVSLRQPMVHTAVSDENIKPIGFLKWLNNTNYNYNIISDKDMEDYSSIASSKLMIIIGHSEYWTREARLHFDLFVKNGHHTMVLSGNTMWWHVRYNNLDSNNPQMICFRGPGEGLDNTYGLNITPFDLLNMQKTHFIGSKGGQYVEDPIANTEPLKNTTDWSRPSLKYSILSSIGSDWLNGGFGYGDTTYTQYGFNGYKVLSTNSPLLTGVNSNFLNFEGISTEFDGTLIKGFDSNGHPIIAKEALGFYKAEIIAYDRSSSQGKITYCPIMAFQKNSSSGIVINVNNNKWCDLDALNKYPYIKIITKNMIDGLLSTTPNVFSSNTTPIFSVQPIDINKMKNYNDASAVNYIGCSDNIMKISPNGIEFQGYRVDAGTKLTDPLQINNIVMSFTSEYCTSGTFQLKNALLNTSTSQTAATKQLIQLDNFKMTIYPNPSSGKFNIELGENLPEKIEVSDQLGREILTINSPKDKFTLDLTEYAEGLYFVKVHQEGKVNFIKIIKN